VRSPLQHAFAVLFFVSVGMLFDPAIILRQPLALLALVGIVVIGKSLAAFGIVLAFRYSLHTHWSSRPASRRSASSHSSSSRSASRSAWFHPRRRASSWPGRSSPSRSTRSSSVPSSRCPRWLRARRGVAHALERPAGVLAELPSRPGAETLHDHVVVVGSGRVGEPVARELLEHDIPFVIVEQSRETAETQRQRGLPVIYGDATRPEVMAHAHLERARLVIVAAPDAYQARAILALCFQLNPGLEVLVRTHSDEERRFLEEMGVARAFVGERELAVSLAREALRALGRRSRHGDRRGPGAQARRASDADRQPRADYFASETRAASVHRALTPRVGDFHRLALGCLAHPAHAPEKVRSAVAESPLPFTVRSLTLDESACTSP
jgi:CPA2 family monovalent cation:H+ antiporter-2